MSPPSRLQPNIPNLRSNGPRTYFSLGIPVIIAGMPLLLRCRTIRVSSAVLLLCWAVIGVLSIGLFYGPSAAMMLWSALEKAA